MSLKILLQIVFFLLVSPSETKVEFTFSTIYDEFDITPSENGRDPFEIPLDACKKGGCSVYVSVPDWKKSGPQNFFVHGKKTGTNVSLFSLFNDYDELTSAKKGLHLEEDEYSILNYEITSVGPIVVYVVSAQAPLYDDADLDIYDASNVNLRPISSKRHAMIMSPDPYNLFVTTNGEENLSAFIRSTGFDNNHDYDQSPDDCRVIYIHNNRSPFLLRINSPIVSIHFNGQANTQICAKIDKFMKIDNQARLDYPGSTTSPGYIGCAANSLQVFRSSYFNSVPHPSFELRGSANADRDVELDFVVNTEKSSPVTFSIHSEFTDNNFEESGDGQTLVTRTESAHTIDVSMRNNARSSYWLMWTPHGIPAIPDGRKICGVIQMPTTVSTPQPTTSSGKGFTIASVLTLLVSVHYL